MRNKYIIVRKNSTSGAYIVERNESGQRPTLLAMRTQNVKRKPLRESTTKTIRRPPMPTNPDLARDAKEKTGTVTIQAELTDEEAWQFAQFIKRSCFRDYRDHAENNEQAYTMIAAAGKIRKSLSDAGYAPR